MFAAKNTTTAPSPSSITNKGANSFIQPKLNVGKPGDKYEVEADKAADQIVAKNNESSAPFFPATPTIQKQSEEVQQQEEESGQGEEEVQMIANEESAQQMPDDTLQTKESSDITSPLPSIQKTVSEDVQRMESEEVQEKEDQEVQTLQKQATGDEGDTSSIENNLSNSKGGGNPLDTNTKSDMESGFGADFSGVRIHNDSNAAQMNQQLGAKAFTNGNDIYFNEGKYNPESDSGKHLLAHELTHTVQQGAAVRRKEEDGNTSSLDDNMDTSNEVKPLEESKTLVKDTENAFIESMEKEIGGNETSLVKQKLPSPSEAKDRAKKEVSEIKAVQTKMAGDKETLIKKKKETEKKNKGKKEGKETQEKKGVESPTTIQKDKEKSNVDIQSIPIPVNEIATSGLKSRASLEKLKGNTDSAPMVSLGESIQQTLDHQKQSVASNTITATSSIKNAAATQKEQTRSTIGNSHQQVQNIMQGTGQQVTMSYESTTQNIQLDQDIAQGTNQENKVSEVTRLRETVVTKKQEAEDVFTQAKTTIGQTGQSEGNRGKQHSDNLANRALELGRRDAAYYRRTEDDSDLGDDKAEAVMQVANRYARKLRNDGNNLKSDVIAQAEESQNQVVAEKEPTISGFNDIGPEAETGVNDYMDQVGDSLNEASSKGKEQALQAKEGADKELSKLNEATDGRAIALKAQGEAQIGLATTSALMSAVNMAGQASTMLDETGEKAIDQINDAVLSETTTPTTPPDIQMQSDDQNPPQYITPADNTAVVNQLGQNEGVLNQAFLNQTNEQISSLNEVGNSSQGAGSSWVSETQQQMSAFQSTVGDGMSELSPAMRNQFEQINTTGHQQISDQVTQIDTDLSQNVSEIRVSVDGSVNEANSSLESGVNEGNTNADGVLEELPSSMNSAAEAQESFFGSIGNWFSEQLADTWEAIKGMADWGFILDLAIGLVVGIAVGLAVAALLAGTVLSGGLLAAVIIGAAAGSAGFAAATMSANVRHGDPLFQGVGHAMILGAFVGAGGAIAGFYGMGLLAGAGVVALAAGVGTVAANLSTGRDWDDHLLANMVIMGIFHVVLKPIVDRIPVRNGRGTERSAPEGVERPAGEGKAEVDPRTRRGCFVKGTLIYTSRGYISIEQLKVGESVYCWNDKKDHILNGIILNTLQHTVSSIYEINIGNTIIKCSGEHPLWIVGKGWLRASELKIGDVLLTSETKEIPINDITCYTGAFEVYNIEVNEYQNYFVSEDNILVHNKAMRWTLIERAKSLKSKIESAILEAESLPEDAPNRGNLIEQARAAEPEANRLAELGERASEPSELEPSRNAIESLEERIIRLEEEVNNSSIPLRARVLPEQIYRALERARNLDNAIAEKFELVRELERMQRESTEIRDYLEENPGDYAEFVNEIEALEYDLRNHQEALDRLSPDEVETEQPAYIRENRRPLARETVLGDASRFERTGSTYQGQQIYEEIATGRGHHLDALHVGEGAEIEVFSGTEIGDPHLGTITPEGAPKDGPIRNRTLRKDGN